MMLSMKPFAADDVGQMAGMLSRFAPPGSPISLQNTTRQTAVRDLPRENGSAQNLAVEAYHANIGHALCPGNELDYSSTAAAMAAVYAVAMPSRRYGSKGTAAALPQLQGSGVPPITKTGGQQRQFIRRNLAVDETAGEFASKSLLKYWANKHY